MLLLSIEGCVLYEHGNRLGKNTADRCICVCSSDAPAGCHCLRETYAIQSATAPTDNESASAPTEQSAFSDSSPSTPTFGAHDSAAESPLWGGSPPRDPASLPITERSWLLRFTFGSMFKRLGRIVLAAFFIVFRPVLFIVLRAAVRSKVFWVKGLKSAYADPSRLSEQTAYYYRLPALVRGWESGIVKFLQARLMSDEDVLAAVSAVDRDSKSSDLASRRNRGETVVGSFGVNFYTAKGVSKKLETRQPGLLLDFEKAVKESGVPVLIVRSSVPGMLSSFCLRFCVLVGSVLVLNWLSSCLNM